MVSSIILDLILMKFYCFFFFLEWNGVILLKLRMCKCGIIDFFYFKKRERDFEYQYNSIYKHRYEHLTHSENKLMKQIVRN